jgi:hypothetical protein
MFDQDKVQSLDSSWSTQKSEMMYRVGSSDIMVWQAIVNSAL